jgi:DNA-binding transcriptional LysR family regulator
MSSIPTSPPSLDSLRCFVAAARLLHFRKASRAVGLTPAAFGQRIRLLEELLGVELFTRSTRSVSLAAAGLRLLPAAERALAQAAECISAARGQGELPPTEVTVGTRHELGMSWLVPRIDELAREHPGVQLHLYFGSGPDLVLRLRTLEIDLAISSYRFTDPLLDELPLHAEEYAFVAAPSLLRKTPLRRVEQASVHTLLDASADLPLFRYLREASEEGASLRFQRIVRLGTIDAIRARVLQGAGVAVLPRYFVARDIAQKRLRRVLPALPLVPDRFRLIFRRDDPRRAVYERMAASLRRLPLR